ncbi:MAG TPA: polysaccharide deacetylase family protein [Candidatus Paceibacterota bacterium]|nr:polysaccharide deacetylase family protein [Candidatus Paceibacterota bacterium]
MDTRIIKKREIGFLFIAFIICAVVVLKYYNPMYLETFGKQSLLQFAYFKYIIQMEITPKPKTAIPEAAPDSLKTIPILLYHGISTNKTQSGVNGEGRTVLLKDFESQMFALHAAGYRTITLAQFVAFREGKAHLPDKPIMITFDDAIKTSYYRADPIFHALGYNAIMFTISGHALGAPSRYYLSKSELKTMIRSGRWQVESHGDLSHQSIPTNATGIHGNFLSNKMYREKNRSGTQNPGLETTAEYQARITSDLESAKNSLEKAFGIQIIGFAFPFNDFGQATKNFPGSGNIILPVASSIYPLLFYQAWTETGYSQNYSYEQSPLVKRIEVPPNTSGTELLEKIEQGETKNLPFSDSFNQNRGWLEMWGSATIKNKQLVISSSDTDSASVFLDGTGYWTNYDFSASTNWIAGKDLEMEAHLKNNQNFLSCLFQAGGGVYAKETKNNTSEILKDVFPPEGVPHGNHTFGIAVDGNKVSCFIDGDAIVSGESDGTLAEGGIGIKTWDPETGGAHVNIEQVLVSTTSPSQP